MFVSSWREKGIEGERRIYCEIIMNFGLVPKHKSVMSEGPEAQAHTFHERMR
jgi:hypothetical protein